ncbi:DUF6197 family protein [Planobispora longispora]|uniref:Uncharacterized protein n=1 Tax=Planobispora longispora TaxID=28887 RepID=A0A8J3W5T4_9ACTN|nr:hypothetical protein [Planobispora longispora]GIH76171.1 hypothetical protein Plo01_26000 [Planobispora longispora]
MTHTSAERLAQVQNHWPVGSRARHPYLGLTGTVVGHARDHERSALVLMHFDNGQDHWMRAERLQFAIGRTTRQVLLGAAGLIARNGWMAGDCVDYDAYPDTPAHLCPLCTLGAIAVAAGLPPHLWDGDAELDELDEARVVLAAAATNNLALHLGLINQQTPATVHAHDLISEVWNDAPGQTAELVISALAQAGRVS